MRTKIMFGVGVAAVAAAAVAGVVGGGQADAARSAALAPSCRTPAIALMAPITGPAASIGVEQRNWGRYAVSNFNNSAFAKTKLKGQRRFVLVENDTQLDAAQASTVAQKIVSDSAILAVVGPAGSQEVESVGPTYARASLAFVSMSATRTTLTAGKYPTFFRVVPNDAVQSPTDANYMIDVLKAKRVFIVDDQTAYSVPLADDVQRILRSRGVTVDRQSVNQKQTDFSALVSRISDDTQVVFLPWQIAANAQLFGQQMREQGKRAVIFGSDGLFSPKDFNIEGSYVSAFAPDIRAIPSARKFVAGYTKRYGSFGTFGPPTYVAVQAAINAINRACQDGAATRAEVLKFTRQTLVPNSLLGQDIRFTPKGDVVGATFFIFRVQNKQYVLVKQPQRRVTAALNGAQEVPRVATRATGRFTGTFTGTASAGTLKWRLTFRGLSGPAAAAHIHIGKRRANGGVVIPLCSPCRSGVSGTAQLDQRLAQALVNDQLYANVHTAKFPNGEIRGQLGVSG